MGAYRKDTDGLKNKRKKLDEKYKEKLKELGKKKKLSLEVIDIIANTLRMGNYIEDAVALAGVGKTTFYLWINIAHDKEPKDYPVSNQLRKLCKLLLNEVQEAQAQATARDIQNIDRCAMGSKPVYDRYPKGTMMPLVNHKGDVQLDHNNEVIMIDVSGQIITNNKGDPVIAEQGIAPDWRASAWRREKRAPKKWGDTKTIITHEAQPITDDDDPRDNDDSIEVHFIKSKEDIEE